MNQKRPRIRITNGTFVDVGTAFHAPGYTGDLVYEGNRHLRVNRVIDLEARENLTDKNKTISVPPDLVNEILSAYQSSNRTHEEALKSAVMERSSVLTFLKEQGISAASFLVAVGQFIVELKGR